jgi:hypothetical protein
VKNQERGIRGMQIVFPGEVFLVPLTGQIHKQNSFA